MTLTDAEILALVGAVVAVLQALSVYLQRQATKAENATTHAKLDALQATVTTAPAVGAAPPYVYTGPKDASGTIPGQGLVDGHAQPLP